jgi:hypothetical protein
MERIFWTSHFFTDEGCFRLSSYVTRQYSRVWSATNPMRSRTHHYISQGWCVVHSVTKLDNGPRVFWWRDQLGTLLWSDSLPLHWAFKLGRICLRLLPTGQCYCKCSSCFHDATVQCVWGQNNFKGHLATMVTRSCTHWLFSVVPNERCSLQGQSSHFFELKEAIADFIRNIPPIELLRVFANKIRLVDVCLQAISTICFSSSKYEKCICINVQGLSEYSHRLQYVHRDLWLTLYFLICTFLDKK